MTKQTDFALDALKRAAAARAVDEVEDGMVVGLGSGSTATMAIELLAERVAKGLRIVGIPTSEKTAGLARRFGIDVENFVRQHDIDLTIDGADQVARGTLDLIKGLGGALLREKIVASASKRLVIVIDETKLVDRLGGRTPVPVEIVSFGWQTTLARLVAAGVMPKLRMADDHPFVTDGGNHIADCAIPDIADPAALESRLRGIVGVVESGLFVGITSAVVVGRVSGAEVINGPNSP